MVIGSIIIILIVVFIISVYKNQNNKKNKTNQKLHVSEDDIPANSALKSKPIEENINNIPAPISDPIRVEKITPITDAKTTSSSKSQNNMAAKLHQIATNASDESQTIRQTVLTQLADFVTKNEKELSNVFERITQEAQTKAENGKEDLVLGFTNDGLYNFTVSYNKDDENFDTLWKIYQGYYNSFKIDDLTPTPLYVTKNITTPYGTLKIVYHLVIAKLNGKVITDASLPNIQGFKVELLISVINDHDAIQKWANDNGLRCNYVQDKSAFNTNYCYANVDVEHKVGVNISWY